MLTTYPQTDHAIRQIGWIAETTEWFIKTQRRHTTADLDAGVTAAIDRYNNGSSVFNAVTAGFQKAVEQIKNRGQ